MDTNNGFIQYGGQTDAKNITIGGGNVVQSTENYYGAAPAPTHEKKVFISYDNTNKAEAASLNEKLRSRGVTTWFDRADITAGEHRNQIAKQIQPLETIIIVCLLSKELAAKAPNASYVKHIEWALAESRYLLKPQFSATAGKEDPLVIIPVAVDDFDAYRAGLPAFIRDNVIYKITDPKLIDEIVRLFEKL